MFLVKSGEKRPGSLRYRDIGDYLTRQEKLDLVNSGYIDAIDWQVVVPNEQGDWINQRGRQFALFTPLGDKLEQAIFGAFSSGSKSNRDSWVYGFSKKRALGNVEASTERVNVEASRADRQAGPLRSRSAACELVSTVAGRD